MECFPFQHQNRAPGVAVGLLLALALLLGLYLDDKGLAMTEEGMILTEAQAVTEGAVLYRDIDVWVTPGVWYLTAGLFEFTGPNLNATRRVMAGLFVLATLLLFVLTTAISSWQWGIFAGGLLCLQHLLAFPAGTFIYYTEFAVFFGLGVAFCLVRRAQGGGGSWLPLAGFFVALSFLFKQNTGVALAGMSLLVLLIYDRSLWGIVSFVAAGIAGVLPVVAYFAAVGALPALIEGLLRPFSSFFGSFNLSYLVPLTPARFTMADQYYYLPAVYVQGVFEGIAGLKAFLPVLQLVSALVYVMPILILIALTLRTLRGHPPERALISVAAIGVAIFFVSFPRADFVHVSQGLPGLFPLWAWLLHKSRSRRWVCGGLALAGFVLVVALGVWSRSPFSVPFVHPRARVVLPVSLHSALTRTLDVLENEIPKDDAILVVPYAAMYYFLSGRKVPHRYTLTMAPNIAKDAGRDLLQKTRAADVRYVLYTRRDFPGAPPLCEYAPAVCHYLDNEFELYMRVDEPLGEHLRIIKRRDLP